MKGTYALALAILCAGCGNFESTPGVTGPYFSQQPFGAAPDGTPIDVVTLRNANGMEVRLMTYGAIVLSIRVPDRDGEIDDVVLGFDTAEEYFTQSPYFGAIVGRYANRIANASFTLGGETYNLTANDGVNHLHGGTQGWDKVVWRNDEPFHNGTGAGVVLRHTSPDGDQGYPGTVEASVTYWLRDDNSLVIDFAATTDAPTIINLAQHSYFNLGGSKTADILGHQLMIPSDRYTPTDATLIPTGEIVPVEGTPFDFRMPHAIGERIDGADPQLVNGKGYDHNWLLDRISGNAALVARVVEPITGRTLEVESTEPGLQFYSGNFLDGTLTGKDGRVYTHRSG